MGHRDDLLSLPRFSSLTISSQLLEQCLGLLEISGVKALAEPPVDRNKQLMGFSPLALLLPQATQAQCRPQLPRFRLLVASNGQGLLEASFRLDRIRDGLPQQQFSLEPIRLRKHVTRSACLQ